MQFLTVMCSSEVWELAVTEMPRPWLPSTSVMWAPRQSNTTFDAVISTPPV